MPGLDTYAALETYYQQRSKTFATSQAVRVGLRLQTAFDYAMSQELLCGHAIDQAEPAGGVSAGILAMFAKLIANYGDDGKRIILSIVDNLTTAASRGFTAETADTGHTFTLAEGGHA